MSQLEQRQQGRRAAPAATRWRVQSISVRAFKSFGGAAPAVFRFDRGHRATCILGANGCGKSALLEALCFALGAPASAMPVRTLREVVSTESDSQVGWHTAYSAATYVASSL